MLSLGYLELVTGGAGYLLYFELLDRLDPVQINLVDYVAPLFAARSGWAVLGESVERTTLVGFAVVVVGCILIERRAFGAVR